MLRHLEVAHIVDATLLEGTLRSYTPSFWMFLDTFQRKSLPLSLVAKRQAWSKNLDLCPKNPLELGDEFKQLVGNTGKALKDLWPTCEAKRWKRTRILLILNTREGWLTSLATNQILQLIFPCCAAVMILQYLWAGSRSSTVFLTPCSKCPNIPCRWSNVPCPQKIKPGVPEYLQDMV